MKRTNDSARGLLFSAALVLLVPGDALAAPTIAGIVPGSGPTEGAVVLTISGIDFSPTGNLVTLDGNACPIVLEAATQIRCTVPEGSGANNDVQVTDDLGGASNTRNFAYDAPSILSITPSSGPELGGTVITIAGSSFGPAAADGLRSVAVGATGEACVVVPGGGDHDQVRCTMPPGTGSGAAVVLVVDGQVSNPGTFDYNPPPAISSILPTAGDTTGGMVLTISGSSFSASGNSVSVGGSSCAVTLESAGTIECTVPEGLGADQDVVVTADGQASNAELFDYNPPSITSIVPDHGPTEGNVPITIQGNNFGPASADAMRSVTVGTTACPLVASSSEHHVITCTLPAGQGAGRTVSVVVAGQASNVSTVDYDPPSIDSVTPTRASAGGGTVLTIHGLNFGQSASVTVDGGACPLTMQSHTELRCTGPAATPGLALPVLVVVSGQIDSFPVEYVAPVCGNGIKDIQTGEVCDDNNLSSGDGCSSDCRAEQPQTDDQVKCILALNKAGAKVFQAAGKDTLGCAKKGSGGLCIGYFDEESGGFAAAMEKVATAFSKKCPTAPDFGSSLVAVIQGANRDRSVDLAVDMFGADPDAALAPDALAPNRGRCQDDVLKAELKYASARLKAFNKCKKAGFKAGTILTDTALGDCLETADNDPAVAKPQQAQFAAMIDSCVNFVEDRALAFPGVCAAAPDTAACLEDRVRCRTCQALSTTDSLADALDCDDDDDGIDNSSCED